LTTGKQHHNSADTVPEILENTLIQFKLMQEEHKQSRSEQIAISHCQFLCKMLMDKIDLQKSIKENI